MFLIDTAYVPEHGAEIVAVQYAAANSDARAQQPDYLFAVCVEVPSEGPPRPVMNAIDPAGWLAVAVGGREGRELSDPATVAAIQIALLEVTTHGRLVPKETSAGGTYFIYEPVPLYEGTDRAVFAADFRGKRYRVVVDLRVSKFVDEKAPVCSQPRLIKIKRPERGA